MSREQTISQFMDDLERRIADGIAAVEDASEQSPQLTVFYAAQDTLAGQRNRLDLSDDSQVRYWFTSATLLLEQIDSEAALRNASWSQGFGEALGRRYLEMLDGLPTAKEALGAGVSVAASTATSAVALAVLAVAVGLIYVYAQERGKYR